MRKASQRVFKFTSEWTNIIAEKMMSGADSDEAAAEYSKENDSFRSWYKIVTTVANCDGPLARDELYGFWLMVEHTMGEMGHMGFIEQ